MLRRFTFSLGGCCCSYSFLPLSTSASLLFKQSTTKRCQVTSPSNDSSASPSAALPPLDFRWAHTKETLQTLGNVTKDFTFTPFQDTGDAYVEMWKAVDNAKSYVIWHTYIAKDDFIGQTTIEKLRLAAERGVRVEYLYDCGGNMTGRRKMVEPLVAAGVKVIRFRPFWPGQVTYFTRGMQWKLSPGVRNHRKILVVDDVVGFTGGLNIGNEYAGTKVGGTGKFRDSHCMITGVEGVRMLKAACADTINPREDIVGTWMSKMIRWRQWAETTYRFNRRANVISQPETENNMNNNNNINSQGNEKKIMMKKFMRKVYDNQRRILKERLSSHQQNQNVENNKKLRTRLRERVKEISLRRSMLKNKGPGKISTISREAWRKLKQNFEERQQQIRERNAKETTESSSPVPSSNREKLSAFVKARGRVMRKSAASLISLMQNKRKQLTHFYQGKQNSENVNQGDDTNNSSPSSTTTAEAEPKSNFKAKFLPALSMQRREEVAQKFQEIFARQRVKIREAISKQHLLIQEKRRRQSISLKDSKNPAKKEGDAEKDSSGNIQEQEQVRLVTPTELPTKSVILCNVEDIHQSSSNPSSGSTTSSTPSSSSSSLSPPSSSSSTNYIVVAVPDRFGAIHSLALNRDSDRFGQLLLCNPLSDNYSLQMALWLVVRRSAARLYVTTPYFLPHRKLLSATIEAARRGVDVRVLTGSKGTTDPWLMWYAQQWVSHRMLRAGVKLYEYHGGAVMHAKTVVADGVWSSVGSYNWDILSNKLMEASFTALDPRVAAEMEQQFENDLLLSEQIVEDTFVRRPLWVQLMCRIIYVVLKASEWFSFRGYGHRDLTSQID